MRIAFLITVLFHILVIGAQGQSAVCSSYCTLMQAYCFSTFNYDSSWCNNECIVLSMRNDTVGVTSGNRFRCFLSFFVHSFLRSLQCRITYAHRAQFDSSQCIHAAPWSDVCVTTGPVAGVAVQPLCDSFCDKQAMACYGVSFCYCSLPNTRVHSRFGHTTILS